MSLNGWISFSSTLSTHSHPSIHNTYQNNYFLWIVLIQFFPLYISGSSITITDKGVISIALYFHMQPIHTFWHTFCSILIIKPTSSFPACVLNSIPPSFRFNTFFPCLSVLLLHNIHFLLSINSLTHGLYCLFLSHSKSLVFHMLWSSPDGHLDTDLCCLSWLWSVMVFMQHFLIK